MPLFNFQCAWELQPQSGAEEPQLSGSGRLGMLTGERFTERLQGAQSYSCVYRYSNREGENTILEWRDLYFFQMVVKLWGRDAGFSSWGPGSGVGWLVHAARSELSVSLSGLWSRHLREGGKLSATEGIQEKRREQGRGSDREAQSEAGPSGLMPRTRFSYV